MISMYYAGFAIAVYAACQSLPFSANNYQQHVYRSYTLLCAYAAIVLFATARLLSAESLDEATAFIKWQDFGAIGFICTLAWLMANYTNTLREPHIQRGLILYTGACAALIAYALTLPYGLFIQNLAMLGTIEVLGSEIVNYQLDFRPESLLFYVLGYAGVVWGAWCCVLMWRRNNHFAASLFASYLVVLTTGYTLLLLYSFGVISKGIPGGATYLWLFVVISLCFGRDQKTLLDQLNKKTETLQYEIERRKLAELATQHQAHTDKLTGLPNHLALHTHLTEQQLSGNHDVRLVLIQIERFREIKRVFSETNCDNMLLQITERLRKDMPGSTFLARIFENCFAVVSATDEGYELDKETGIGLWADGIELTGPYLAGYQPVELSFSAGITNIYTSDSAKNILYRAEHALDKASGYGPQSIVYYSKAFAEEVAWEQRLEDDLQNVIERGELALHYQPIVDQNQNAKGAEALLRWHHPELGMIPPSTFIPLAERSGLMTAIGESVIEMACQQVAAWQKDTPPFRGRLSLNVSSWQLQTEDFADRVLSILARHEVSPQWLTLELTESALVDNIQLTCTHLQKLRSQGTKIALDDFGTGFSSLAYLSKLPLDTLKIDRAFVNDIGTERGRELLIGMIEIGKALKLSIVVEGVETEKQFLALHHLGPNYYQGYLFCRPLPPDDLLSWAQDTERKAS